MNTLKITCLIAAFLNLSLTACSQQNEDSTNVVEPVKKVHYLSLVSNSPQLSRRLTGRVQAANTVPLTFEVTGIVSKVNVNLGDTFKKGKVLAELDQRVFQLNLSQRASTLAESQASLSEARLNFERNRSLLSQNLVSQASLDTAKANYDIALQRVNVAQSALAIAQENLSDTQLIAPFNGKISARFIEPSQQINPSQAALEVQGDALLEVTAAIPEGYINRIKHFDSANITIPSYSTADTLKAKITEIGSQASVANAFPVVLTLDLSNQYILPGMSAEILLLLSSDNHQTNDNLFTIPVGAYSEDAKGQFIFIIDSSTETFILKRHPIHIKQLLAEQVIIETDLPAGQKIVSTGLSFLRPNQSVELTDSRDITFNQ